MRNALMSLILVPSLAVANCNDDAMLVFDGSTSMRAQTNLVDRPTRIAEAREAVRGVLPDVAPFRRIGLIVYGPGDIDGCSAVTMRLPPTANAADEIIEEIDGLRPDGSTALTSAVRNAAGYLTETTGGGTVVLVTDGEETCGGRTCDVASAIASTAPDITVHVIGFRMRATYLNRDYSEFALSQGTAVGAECLAAQTGGIYVTPSTISELVDALYETLSCQVTS